MRKRGIFCLLLLCMVLMGSLMTTANAVSVSDTTQTFSVTRASGRFSVSVPGNSLFEADSSFPLDAGETVTIDASYSPRSASVDFGLIAPDGGFYPVHAENGSIYETIEVDEPGNYTFAIRNNSSAGISASGYVRY